MHIPKLLIYMRLCMAPIIIYLSYTFGEPAVPYLMGMMYLGLISDIFDGIIARKTQQSTELLRRLDSQVDMVFWVSIAVATWMLRQDLLRDNLIGVYTLLGMEACCYVVSWLKFKKETCTHALLSKLWGISLLVAFTALLGYHKAGVFFYSCVGIGFVAHLDVIMIVLLLPQWTHDVPSSYHAWQIRKGQTITRNKWFNG